MQKTLDKNIIYNDAEFQAILSDILENETVLKMKNYRQHFDTSCYDHCLTVAFYNYIICKKLGLDYKSAARARYATRPILIRLAKTKTRRKRITRIPPPTSSIK